MKKLTNDGIDPFTLTWVPILIGGILALGTGFSRGKLSKAAVIPGVILGFVSGGGPSLIFNYGFDQLPAGIVTLLISLGPIFTAIVAHFVFDDERFNSLKGTGLVLAYGGVMILTIDSVGEKGSLGNLLLVLAGSALAGSGGVLTRYYIQRHDAIALLAPN
ncbi:MAG: DMT family transporter, partial [Actinomycetota bacterium]|nr:DMT family transporter [Actinomycetota bacterium]